MSLIGKATFQSNLGKWHCAVDEERLCLRDTPAEEPGIGSDSDSIGKGSNEIGRGEPTQARKFGDVQSFGEMIEHKALRDPDLPRCKQGPVVGAASVVSSSLTVRRWQVHRKPERIYARRHTHSVAMATPVGCEAGLRALGFGRSASSTTTRMTIRVLVPTLRFGRKSCHSQGGDNWERMGTPCFGKNFSVVKRAAFKEGTWAKN